MLIDGDGATVYSSRESLAGGSESTDVKNARIPITKHIPLRDIRPGRYTLRYKHRLLGGGTQPVARETVVMIVP